MPKKVVHASAVRGIVRRVRPPAVDVVDGLAPDVRVGLVQGAGLPGVDEVVRVLRVGVAPLVAGHVVGREAGAERDERPVPRGIGAAVAAVEDRVHDRAGAVERVAAEGLEEEVVRLLRRDDHVVGFRRDRRERVALFPVRRGRVRRRNSVEVLSVVRPAVQIVHDAGEPVDGLARVRIHEDELADVRAVADLDLPGQVALALDALEETRAVDREHAGPGEDLSAFVLARDERDRHRSRLGGAAARDGVHADARHEVAVDGDEPSVALEVGADHAREDGHAPVRLLVRQVVLAELVGALSHEGELGVDVLQAEHPGVLREERPRLARVRQPGSPPSGRRGNRPGSPRSSRRPSPRRR